MTPPLLSALARVLASIDAPRNLRALYGLLTGFCMAGLLLAMARSALGRDRPCSARYGLAWGWLSPFSASTPPA